MLAPGTLSTLMSKHENLSAEAATWLAVASGQAELKLSQAGTALRMDFDFKGGGGFVVARREFERAMPEDYVLRLRLRGRGPLNNLEIKLVDGTGQNVWRHVKKDLALPARWTKTKVTSREMEFAWGPAGGGVMASLGAIEIAIVAVLLVLRAGGSQAGWGFQLQSPTFIALLAAGIFAFVFGKVAHLDSGDAPYLLFCYAGLLAWNFFA